MLLPSEIGVASKFLVSIEVFFSSQVIQQKYGNNDLKLYQNSFDAFESHPPQLISPSLLFMNRNLANWMQINVTLFLKGIEHDEIWAKYFGETLTNVKIFRFINERYWPPVSKNPKLQRNSTFFVQNSKFLIIFENYERKHIRENMDRFLQLHRMNCFVPILIRQMNMNIKIMKMNARIIVGSDNQTTKQKSKCP